MQGATEVPQADCPDAVLAKPALQVHATANNQSQHCAHVTSVRKESHLMNTIENYTDDEHKMNIFHKTPYTL